MEKPIKRSDGMNLHISDDQNMINTLHGCFHFFEDKKKKCSKCWFFRFDEACDRVPCSPSERKDKKDGVFSIRETPEIK